MGASCPCCLSAGALGSPEAGRASPRLGGQWLGTRSLSRIRPLRVTKTWCAALRLTHTLAGALGLPPRSGSPRGQAVLQAAVWRRGLTVGGVTSVGGRTAWEHRSHKKQADPGSKGTVRAPGESLAAARPGTPHPRPHIHHEKGGPPRSLRHRLTASSLSGLSSPQHKSGPSYL